MGLDLPEALHSAAQAAAELRREVHDARSAWHDVNTQLNSHFMSISGLRTEVREDIARLDAKVVEGFDRIETQLASIVSALAKRGP